MHSLSNFLKTADLLIFLSTLIAKITTTVPETFSLAKSQVKIGIVSSKDYFIC